jgi:Trk-type K+ transport system membrane component
VTLAFSTLAVSIILLATVEEAPFLDLLFEEISAFATVGLYRGITSDLSMWGKIIIIISMFVCRLGSLTLAASFVTKRDNRKYQYPEESMMVS